jgi:hypothetical protein
MRACVVAVYGDADADVLPKQEQTDVRLVLVSDTHSVDPASALFPDGDLLLHAGDHTVAGT